MSATPAADPTGGEQSIGTLVTTIRNDLSSLVRGEVELAKAEMRESAKRAGAGGALVGLVGYLGLLVTVLLSIAAAYGLVALGLHPGWAFLIVAGAYLLVAAVLALIARSRFSRVRGPEGAKRIATRALSALRPRPRT